MKFCYEKNRNRNEDEYMTKHDQAIVTKDSPSLNQSNFLPVIMKTKPLSLNMNRKQFTAPFKKNSYRRASYD